MPKNPDRPDPDFDGMTDRETVNELNLSEAASRIECGTGGTMPELAEQPDLARYAGVTVDGEKGVLDVYWKGTVPKSVRDRVRNLPKGLRIAWHTGVPHSAIEIEAGRGRLGGGMGVPPPVTGGSWPRGLGLCSVSSSAYGTGIDVTYCYADGSAPPRDEVDAADVEAALETRTGGVTVNAAPGEMATAL